VEPALSSYNFKFVGGEQNVYLFESRLACEYEIKFKPSGYLVSDADLEEYIFELVITLSINPFEPSLPAADGLLAPTIAQIVADFLNSHERVVVYICDDSDSRADARRKLFDGWFRRFSKKRYVKIELSLGQDENGQDFTAELVARFDNLLVPRIYESFLKAISAAK